MAVVRMRRHLVRGVATAAAFATVTALAPYVLVREFTRGASEADQQTGLQWIESGHRTILVDLDATDEDDAGRERYPAHVSADQEAVVDVQEVR
ncbi:hypothetical protein JCM17092_33740 [Haloplanus litoreus]